MLFILLLLCAVIAFCLYVKKCNNYWVERGVTTVPTNLIFGASFDLLLGRRLQEEIYEDIYKRCKPQEHYVGIYDMMKPILFIRDPELIHQITIKDFSYFHDRQKFTAVETRLKYGVATLEGQEWKIVRNKLSSTFSSSKLKKMFPLIEECADMMVEQHFRPRCKAGKAVDVKEVIARFALDVIGKCAFGLEFNTLEESDSLYRKVGKMMSDNGVKSIMRKTLLALNPGLLKWFGLKATTKEMEDFFFNLLHDAEKLRQKESEHRGDFLQLMLDIRDEDNHKTSHLFTENHIASNMFIFYFAGHDPASSSLTFALYELTMHPEIQEKLRREIEKAREANGGYMDYNTIINIDYLEMFLSELLRIHGPSNFNVRLCNEAYQVPGSSLKIKPGELILYSISALHKDENHFPNPSKFDPERFSKSNLPQINPKAYQPFGSGPRMCIGTAFAKLQIKVCLVAMISRFKFSRHGKTKVPIVLKKRSQYHQPANEVWLSIEEI